MNHRSHNIIHVPIAIQQGIWKIIAEIPILVSNVVEKVLLKSVVARNLHLLDTWVVKDARVLASIVLRYLDIVQHVQKMVIHTKIIAGLQKLKDNFPSPPFGQSFLSAAVRIGSLAVRMAAFSCAWVWRSGRGGLHG